jgi:hypothetical protein
MHNFSGMFPIRWQNSEQRKVSAEYMYWTGQDCTSMDELTIPPYIAAFL